MKSGLKSAHAKRAELPSVRRNHTSEMHEGEFEMAFETSYAEKHFTPRELAELWKLDESTIRRMFIDEPGVLVYGKENRRDGRRQYVTLRISEGVARRVYEQRTRRAS